MGKKRVAKKQGSTMDSGLRSRAMARAPKKKVEAGVLHVHATFNNTKALLADKQGNALMWSSSGSLGFSGAKKGTPFAAAKVGELLADKALIMGMKEAEVIIRGVGAGRESVMRSFTSKGIPLTRITDDTPIPHNGPKAKKPRRV